MPARLGPALAGGLSTDPVRAGVHAADNNASFSVNVDTKVNAPEARPGINDDIGEALRLRLYRSQFQLREAEQRILLLAGADEENQPILTPFQHSATAGETAKPEPKRSVRKRPDEPRTTY